MKHPRTDVADGISWNLMVCYFVYLKCKVRDYKTSIAPPLLLRCMYQAEKWALNSLCFMNIDFASFYDFAIGLFRQGA
jgi:hypothetical protein